MGLWNILKRGTHTESQNSGAGDCKSLNVENRLFDRYYTPDQDLVYLRLKTKKYFINSLSYGGISVSANSDEAPTTDQHFEGELFFLGKSSPCSLKRIYHINGNLGLQFLHMQPESLLFLRSFLEYFRIGKSLQRISAEFTKQKDQQLLYFRGDGPTDLSLRPSQSQQNSLDVWLHLTLRQKQKYYECIVDQEKAITAKSIIRPGTSAQMIPDSEIDKEIIFQAICILMAMPEQEPTLDMRAVSNRLIQLL